MRKIRLLLQEQVYGATNGRTPLIMGHECKFTPFDSTPAELDFINSRQFTKEEICAILRVPIDLLGKVTVDKLTLEEIRQMFWQETVFISLVDNMKDTLNLSLLPEFYSGEALRNRNIVYNITKVEALVPYYGEKVRIISELTNIGYPINLANRRFDMGLEDIDGGNTGYIQAARMPIGFVHDRIIREQQSDDVVRADGSRYINVNEIVKNPDKDQNSSQVKGE
jgi:hypothetical protein